VTAERATTRAVSGDALPFALQDDRGTSSRSTPRSRGLLLSRPPAFSASTPTTTKTGSRLRREDPIWRRATTVAAITGDRAFYRKRAWGTALGVTRGSTSRNRPPRSPANAAPRSRAHEEGTTVPLPVLTSGAWSLEIHSTRPDAAIGRVNLPMAEKLMHRPRGGSKPET